MDTNKLFVVAIDFGTTYSGYAFSNISNKNNVLTYNWSTGISQASKTPTSILFSPNKIFHSFGYAAEEKYARLTQDESRRWYFFKRFKMTLYKTEDLNKTTVIKDFIGKEMKAMDVFSAGIRFLKEHLFEHFQERIHILREDDIHWVLTVPAIWDEKAKKFMRESAVQAGIKDDQLTLALEPEAAALHCQLGKDITELQPLPAGETFLLLDCGGGTVDITVHEVRHDLRLKELHRASGGPWGGIRVDDAFQEYLMEMFDDYDLYDSLSKSDVLELNRSFEVLKKTFDGTKMVNLMQIPFDLRQKASPEMLVAGRLKLELSVVESFFSEPVKNICAHIKEILQKVVGTQFRNVNNIILVGGFGESRYLQREIQRHFPFKTIVSPAEPASAVVRGAVEFGHCPEKILYRMSPYTFGVDTLSTFSIEKHPFSKLKKIEDKYYCTDIFAVHVKMNQLVETGCYISDATYYPIRPSQTSLGFTVYESTKQKPQFVDDPSCRLIGRFQVDVPSKDSGLQRGVNVKMIFTGTELKVEARSVHSGELVQSTFRF